MIQRVEQLLNGKFEYECVQPVLSEKEIRFVSHAGDIAAASFVIMAPDEKKIRGFLYSSNPRVALNPMEFSGISTRISCQADTTGLNSGDRVEGNITVCTDHGELSLPFEIFVQGQDVNPGQWEEPYTASWLEEQARKDMEKTAAFFVSGGYAAYLKKEDPREYALSRPLRESSQPLQGLEEYLISIGRKEAIFISADRTEIQMESPAGSERHTVNLKRSTWGYLEITVSSDARFLRPERKKLTTLDFVGDTFQLDYIVDVNFLHGGKNYGKINIGTCYGTECVEICVQMPADLQDTKDLRVRRLMQKRLLTLYIDLRLKRIEMQTWIDRSRNVISGYKRAGGNSLFADLFLAQLCYAEGKRTKGSHILQEIGQKNRFASEDQYAYYLYMTTFYEKDASYVDQVEAKIQQMFLHRRNSWIMQWILLYLQEKYLRDDAAKLDAIEQQVISGCCSPIMYLEACQIIRKDPYLLRKLELFEKKILLFAVREKIMTEELAYHVANLSLQMGGYDRLRHRILCGCREISDSDDILCALLSLLIEGGKKDPKYFSWYALGVDRELRIPGLYEYYMETMDTVGIEKMPQIIRMYFSYNNTLNYHKKASIYRNISDNRESVPQVYRSSRIGIEHFITEQLEMGHVDPDLAVLYERFITRRMLTGSLAKQLVKVMFTFEIICKNPNMKYVTVIHENLRENSRKELVNGKARVRIYTENARIYLEDAQGQKYSSASLFSARRFMDSPLLITYCRELIPENPGLILYICSRSGEVTRDNIGCFIRACEMDILQDEYRMKCRRKVLDYYSDNQEDETLYDYLKSISYPEYIAADKKKLIGLLTQEGFYEEAFHLLETYGTENVDPSCLVRICSQMVLTREYEENPLLLAFCRQCFGYGKYNDNILTYLLLYYDGPIEEMKRLWNTASVNELDTVTFEEKILSLLLFTRTGSAGTEPIFRSYTRKMGTRKICTAYVNLRSYEYLVKNLPVSDVVFRSIEKDLGSGREMEDVCRLALLRYYSGLPELSEERTSRARMLLREYCGRDIRFAFYRKFPQELRSRCQLEDRVFLEYVANPEHNVVLFFRRAGENGAFIKEPMRNCFEGIFVREFILFDGEELECFMEEYSMEGLVRTTDHIMLSPIVSAQGPQDRFRILCRMSREAADGDEEKLEKEIDNYYQLEYLTKEIITLV